MKYNPNIDPEKDCVIVMRPDARVAMHIPDAAIDMIKAASPTIPSHVMLTLTMAFILDKYPIDPEVKKFTEYVKAAIVNGMMMNILDDAEDEARGGRMH